MSGAEQVSKNLHARAETEASRESVEMHGTASSASTDAEPGAALRVQITGYDSYQIVPSALDKRVSTINGHRVRSSARIATVPVLRVYGKLPTGHSCVVHVHDVFPYIYVRYLGRVMKEDPKIVDAELEKLQTEINVRLGESFARSRPRTKGRSKSSRAKRHKSASRPANSAVPVNEDVSSASDSESDVSHVSPTSNYVADLSLVGGVPFYGHHLGHFPFVKISLTSSAYAVRLTRLLHEGVIFDKFIQPFETHVPHLLQFLTDYNLFSMDWLSMKEVFFRAPLVATSESLGVGDVATNATFQPFFTTDLLVYNTAKLDTDLKQVLHGALLYSSDKVNVLDSAFPRMARTMVELDICAGMILNRAKLQERDIHNVLFEKSSTLEKCVGYFDSTRTLLDDVNYLRKQRSMLGNPPTLFENIQRTFSGQSWYEQPELDRLFAQCLEKSKMAFSGSLENVEALSMAKYKWLDAYPTAFAVIDALHIDVMASGALKSHLHSLPPEIYLRKEDPGVVLEYLLSNKASDFAPLQPEHDLEDAQEGELENDYDLVDAQGDLGNGPEFDLQGDQLDDQREEQLEELEHPDIDLLFGEIPHLTQDKPSVPQSVPDTLPVNNLTKSLHDSQIDTPLSSQLNPLLPPSDLNIFAATQHPKLSSHSFPPTSQDNPTVPFKQHFSDMHPLERVLEYRPDSRHPKIPVVPFPDFMASFETFGQLKIEYPDPHFSKLANYDTEPFYYAGEKFLLQCNEVDSGSELELALLGHKCDSELRIWKYMKRAPKWDEVKQWLRVADSNSHKLPSSAPALHTQIRGPTQALGKFKYSSLQTPVERKSTHAVKLSMLTMEVLTSTRGSLTPDPAIDSIRAVFWTIDATAFGGPAEGAFVVGELPQHSTIDIACFQSELEMGRALIGLVELSDPDILAGFEVNALSWGYLIERFRKRYNMDLLQRLSRVVFRNKGKLKDSYGYRHSAGVRVVGRHVLNIWRQMRRELTLGHYSLENLVFHLFHKRIPVFTAEKLMRWWDAGDYSIVIAYMMARTQYASQIVERLEVIEKVCEQSRLLGCDFHSMIYRGSQFKVECLMVRMAKQENYILVSPSKKQVFAQDPLKCIPLVMEPESGFYKSPLVVLDFQSLYPSLVVAYNICYSTYLGKLEGFDPGIYSKTGVTRHKLQQGVLERLQNHVHITPNGVIFAKAEVRQSLLAKMLIELLDARLLVKGTMAGCKDEPEVQKLYDKRQLGLKLIANVTYGYTSASYSGRMPNSDVADAIVSCGRETLLKAVKLIEEGDWGAKVVYGDTDSLFVYLPGKSKEDAFEIGKSMARAVTASNPSPMKLKFEKVYLPSVLLSKKRYMGWSFEWEGQKVPKFDAKGIETVRRDGIPAQAKILEKCLLMLFGKRDVSEIKDYVVGEFTKVETGRVGLEDFAFCKEVRVGTYKNEAYVPPGARLSMKRIKDDPRSAPQYRERVMYVVRRGERDELLRDRCMSPEAFLMGGHELDARYYIDKVLVPPLERVFVLVGVDVRRWVREMPKRNGQQGAGVGLPIRVANCMVCGDVASEGNLCEQCRLDPASVLGKVGGTLQSRQRRAQNVWQMCRVCVGDGGGGGGKHKLAPSCSNMNCQLYYKRERAKRQLGDFCNVLEKVEW